jgi:hypothetical protein
MIEPYKLKTAIAPQPISRDEVAEYFERKARKFSAKPQNFGESPHFSRSIRLKKRAAPPVPRPPRRKKKSTRLRKTASIFFRSTKFKRQTLIPLRR